MFSQATYRTNRRSIFGLERSGSGYGNFSICFRSAAAVKFKEDNRSGTRVCCPDALLLHHTATFQVELLLAGDVEPNPGDSEGNNSRRNSQPNGNNFNTRNIILHINSRSLIRLREGGGTPLVFPYINHIGMCSTKG